MSKMTLGKSISTEKIINILLNIFIVLFSIILLISIFTGVQVKVLGHKYANFFGYSIFEVQTDSMADEIFAGDWIVVKLTQNVKMNDIITFELEGDYLTHRVVEIYKETYITKGDANSGKDDPIDKSQIVGKVNRVLGGFGILRKTLFNPAVLITLIITLYLFNSALKKEKDENNIIIKIKELINKIKNRKQSNIPEIKSEQIQGEAPSENLEDTAGRRVIIIDSLGVEQEPYDPYDNEDLEKTSLFRVVPVDIADYDETLLEIARNEMAEQKDEEEAIIRELEKTNEEEQEETEDEKDEEEELTNIDLELINNCTKRTKTMIDTMTNIKKEELGELITTFIGEEKLAPNEATIKNAFITTYIHAKYYNYYQDSGIEFNGRNLISKIEKIIKYGASELIDDYNGKDTKYDSKVKMYSNLISLIANLDYAKSTIRETKAKKEFFKSEIKKIFPDWDKEKIDTVINEVIRIQKSYIEVIKYFLKKLETNTFFLDFEKTAKKGFYATDLKHNLNFSKVYSDYIIDKTYNEGLVAEDSIPVLFTLLLKELIQDMDNAEFTNKYIVHLPETLYKKEKKLAKHLKMLDDEYAKAHVIILLSFTDLINNKQAIKKVKKLGYRFALYFDEDETLPAKEKGTTLLVEHIFVNKKGSNYDDLIAYIPDELEEKLIYDDIISGFDSIGGKEK